MDKLTKAAKRGVPCCYKASRPDIRLSCSITTKMTVVWGPSLMYCADQPLNSPKGPSSLTMTTAQLITELYFRRPATSQPWS